MRDLEQRNGSALYLAGVCLVASLGGLLFGFDTAVISGTIERVSEQFGLSDLQQGWFTSAAIAQRTSSCDIGVSLPDPCVSKRDRIL